MFTITRNTVIDRISNRIDSVKGILSTDPIGRCLLHMRYLTHRLCFATAPSHHRSAGHAGLKRVTCGPVRMLSAMPRSWQLRQTASAARGARSAG